MLIVTPSLTDTCLDVFPLKRWEAFEARVAELPRFDENVIKLRRLYVSAAVDCEIDGQGRVLVPQSLRERAKLDKAIVWAGMGEKAELWANDLWQRASAPADEDRAFVRAIATELKL